MSAGRVVRIAIGCAVGLLALAGCSSSPTSSAEWSSPQDVVDGISAAKLPCRASGDPTIDTSSEAKGYSLIACDDYAVILITNKDTFDATDRGNCTRLDAAFLASAGKQEIVIGPTFRVASVAQDGSFPSTVTAAALAKGLGGKATTIGDYYSGICAFAPPSTGRN